MLHKVHKVFWSYEKEEQWLNEMASRGLMLKGYCFFTFLFEKGLPGEYIYRMELLDNLPSNLESKSYINFLEDSGVECVCSFMRWVYFRKKSADGSFNLFSDYNSRIKHYRNIYLLLFSALILNIFAFMLNIVMYINKLIPYLYKESYIWKSNKYNSSDINRMITSTCANFLPRLIISLICCIVLSIPILSYVKKIRKLKKEKLLHE